MIVYDDFALAGMRLELGLTCCLIVPRGIAERIFCLLDSALPLFNHRETSCDAKRRTTERLCGSQCENLRGGAARSGTLERQSDVRQQMFNRAQQARDRVPISGGAKILRGNVQIDLRAGDLAMAEQIANRHQTYAFANEV